MLRKALVVVGLTAALGLFSAASAAEWEMSVNTAGDAAGMTIAISHHQTLLVDSVYNFWAANWAYQHANFKCADPGAAEMVFEGPIGKLGITGRGKITQPKPNQLRYTITLEADAALTGIIGGGLEWHPVLDSPALGAGAGAPELLENNTGWKWSVGGGQELRIEFEEPIVSCYFERGNKSKVRTHLVGDSFPKGSRTFTMVVTLPEGGRVAKALEARYASDDKANWYKDALPHDASPVDLSFLNDKPAGKHGFIQAKGDELVFEDGTPARFWSGNIAAGPIFGEKDQIEQQARRIAQLGYNMMRFHHHDSTSWVGRTVIDKTKPDSQHMDAEVLERLDYWIKCLKDNGVYVWLDLHVGREFKTADNIPGFDSDMNDGGKGAGEGKGFCYYNERIEQLMQEFNQRYLTHVNSYTGLAYKDDPAIMGLLITNENDLTGHFGNSTLPDKNNPYHNKIFEAAVTEFAQAKGLDRQATWQTWVPGPSKLYLADREHAWNVRMLAHLESLGVKVPVATTQMWGGMAMFGLPALTASGIIDVHSYGGAEALSANPRFKDNYIHYANTGQAYGKPMAISEWNVPYPREDRFTAPLYVASIGALQGWDVPMIYNYSQRGFDKPSRPYTWSTFMDAALTGMMPAAALVYRRGDVSPAEKTYCIQFSKENLYFQGSHPKNMASLRTLVEQSKVTFGLPDTKELDWDAQTKVASGVEVVTDLDKDFIPAGQDFVRSDTGQITRNWVEGWQTIDTDGTQAAQGWIGGKKLQIAQVTFEITTPKAAVAVSSLDSKPISGSKRILITAIARVVASGGGRTPMLSEPVTGKLTIKAPAGLKLVPLAGDGSKLAAVPVQQVGGAYTVSLPVPKGTHWFMLE